MIDNFLTRGGVSAIEPSSQKLSLVCHFPVEVLALGHIGSSAFPQSNGSTMGSGSNPFWSPVADIPSSALAEDSVGLEKKTGTSEAKTLWQTSGSLKSSTNDLLSRTNARVRS
jgi:hypothetical protein